jgi:hypothetical protein
MRKLTLVPAVLLVLLIGCDDKQKVISEPEIQNFGPRASDGLSPTEYAILHGIRFDVMRVMPEDFFPTDTLFGGDYIYAGGDCDGRLFIRTKTDNLGNRDSLVYCLPFECIDYLIIYSPTEAGAVSSKAGCEGTPYEDITRAVGPNSSGYFF